MVQSPPASTVFLENLESQPPWIWPCSLKGLYTILVALDVKMHVHGTLWITKSAFYIHADYDMRYVPISSWRTSGFHLSVLKITPWIHPNSVTVKISSARPFRTSAIWVSKDHRVSLGIVKPLGIYE